MGPTGLSLAPGDYLLELRAEPSVAVDADVLRRALEAAGLSDVIVDEPGAVRVPPHVGAAMALVGAIPLSPLGTRSGPSPSAGPALSSPIARRVSTPAAASLSSTALRAAAAPPALRHASAPAASSLSARSLSTAASAPAPSPPPTLSDLMHRASQPQTAPAPPTVAERVRQAAAANAARAQPKRRSPLGGLGAGGGGGGPPDASSSPDAGGPPPPDLAPDPGDDRYATDKNTGSRYYMDPGTGTVYGVEPDGGLRPVDQQTLAPVPGAGALPPPPPPPAGTAGPAAGAPDEAGGDDADRPYGEDPGFSMHVGAAALPAAAGDVYRVIARAEGRVTLRPAPGLSWAARRLSVDPYADVPLRTRPFILAPGLRYDVVTLARDKVARSRGDVWTLAEAMGFEPHAIALLRRDIYPPRRTGGYSRWLLVATWRGPHTVTTAEEPLVLDQVGESA